VNVKARLMIKTTCRWLLQKSADNLNKGVDYMLMAAEAGDRSAMLYMAKAYETGVGLGETR